MQRKAYTFALCGEDARQHILCTLLRQRGHTVILLPGPDIPGALRTLPAHTYYITPSASEEIRSAAKMRGIGLLEYGKEKAYLMRNAAITAENALQTAMEHMDTVLQDGRVLVIGCGRIGSALCRMLYGMGVPVSCAARRAESLEAVRACGCGAVPLEALAQAAVQANVIFNTVPALVLPREVLAQTLPEVQIFDLASAPGGVDFAAAAELNRRAVHALALPGKKTPRSAAQAILEAVCRMLQDEEVKL